MQPVLLLVFVLIRFAFIKLINEKQNHLKEALKLWNNLSLVTGLLVTIGALIVANYRITEMSFIHGIGANIVFYVSAVDMLFQSRSAFILSQKCIGITRAILSLLMLFFTLMVYIFGYWSLETNPLIRDMNYRLHWDSTQEGYCYHMISVISEWILMGIQSVYYLTFVSQFKQIKLAINVSEAPNHTEQV